MNVFVTITANLPKNDFNLYEAVSEQEYTLSGIVSSTAKLLILDDEIIKISPYTYTWTAIKKAPKTGVNTKVTHIIRVFGSEADPHQISNAANYIDVLVLPACN